MEKNKEYIASHFKIQCPICQELKTASTMTKQFIAMKFAIYRPKPFNEFWDNDGQRHMHQTRKEKDRHVYQCSNYHSFLRLTEHVCAACGHGKNETTWIYIGENVDARDRTY